MASLPLHYKSHVAVFSFPVGTHAAPLLALVKMLAAASPQVRFSFFNTEQGNARISSRGVVENVTNIKVYDMWDGVPEGYKFCSDDFVAESVALFLKAVPENIRKGVLLAEAESGLKVGCLFTDSWFWFAADMAEEMCVPWVGYWAAGTLPLATHVNDDLILAILHERAAAGKQMAQECPFHQIPGMSTIRICDVPKLLLEDRYTIYGNLHHQMALTLPKAAAVVLNSFEELDTVVTQDLKSKLQTNVLSIGPLPVIINQEKAPQSSSNNECMIWLDKQKTASVAYISFGTLMKCEPDELVACAEALEAIQVPYLWSLPQSEMHILPEGFLERTKTSGSGKMVTWAPQLDVLNHPSVGAHVTHCGWNSMLESIAGGVPIIGRPFLGEHLLTIRLAEEVWKFGVKLDGGVFTKSGLMKALEVVLLSEDGKKLRDNICCLREEAVKAVGLNGGSSTLNFNILKEIITSAK